MSTFSKSEPTARPVVSVVLQTYNHAPYIAQAIESVLAQRAPFPFEVVIADDYSADGTRAVVSDYAQRAPEMIRLILPPRHVGANELLRAALGCVRGAYVAWLDGDDYWTSPAKLHRQSELLEERSDLMACFHDVSLIYGAAGVPSGTVLPNREAGTVGPQELIHQCFIAGPSPMLRRQVIAHLPPWIFDFRWVDWLIYLQAVRRGSIGYLREPLAAYRVHQRGMFSGWDRSSQLEEDLRLYRRLRNEAPEWRQLIERSVADRHHQLAVERCGLPFDSPIVVLDSEPGPRPYFNGRHAERLPLPPPGGEDTAADVITATSRLRRLSPAVGDYRSREGSAWAPADDRAFVLVSGAAEPLLASHSGLRGLLDEKTERIYKDRWCAIYRLRIDPTAADLRDRSSPTAGRESRWERRITLAHVSLEDPSPPVRGASVEEPRRDGDWPDHAVYVSGWVLGSDRAPRLVRLEAGDEAMATASVGDARPDLAAAYPDCPWAGRSGFHTTLNLAGATDESTVWLSAVWEELEAVPLGTVTLRRST